MNSAGKAPHNQGEAEPVNKRNQVMLTGRESDHCRYIHLQADQNPQLTPIIVRGAVQKMPVPNL